MATASFLLCLCHCCAGHFCHCRSRGDGWGLEGKTRFSMLLLILNIPFSLHSKGVWEAHPSFSFFHLVPSCLRSAKFTFSFSAQRHTVPVFTSHRAQHEVYTEVGTDCFFLLKKNIFHICHPFKTMVIISLIS